MRCKYKKIPWFRFDQKNILFYSFQIVNKGEWLNNKMMKNPKQEVMQKLTINIERSLYEVKG